MVKEEQEKKRPSLTNLIRNSGYPDKLGYVCKPMRVLIHGKETDGGLYGQDFVYKQPTTEGEWRVYRKNQTPDFLEPTKTEETNGFCAVYYSGPENIARTMFVGEIEGTEFNDEALEPVKKTLIELTDNVIEEKGWLRKSLNVDNGKKWGTESGTMTYCALGILGVFDLALGLFSLYSPETISYSGVSVSMVKTFLGEDTSLLTRAAIGFGALATGVGLLLQPKLQSWYFGKKGKQYDEERFEELPDVALDYKYGREAVDYLEKEGERLEIEQGTIEAYSRVAGAHKSMMARPLFAEVYRIFYHDHQDAVPEIRNRLKQQGVENMLHIVLDAIDPVEQHASGQD